VRDALTVGVLGAAGIIAPAIVRDLAESEEVEAMRLLDLDGARAAEVAARHGAGRASAEAVDARDGLASVLADCDVLVNSASYRINVAAMRACLDAGCHYLDLGGLYWVTDEQLELNDEFERADLVAVLGIGSAPGKTNLMARSAVQRLDGAEIESVHVAAAGRDPEAPPGLSLPYALRTLLDELTLPPVVVREGKPVEVEPLSDGGVMDYGAPIGEAETIYTLHSEPRTFPQSFDCSETSFRLSLAPALLERLRELAGVAPEEVERAQASALPASAKTFSMHLADATATDGRRVRVSCLTPPHEGWRLGGGVVSTASPAAATVRLLARGQIGARGALPPERCIDPDDMFPELERRGCEFRVHTREAINT
jgi:saccharopine dehydrogenase (NAD+, L-lysine-forming)